MQRELLAAMMVVPFVAMIGVVVAILVYSRRKRRRVKADIAAKLAIQWEGVVTGVFPDREHHWWHEKPRNSAPRLVLRVAYRDSHGVSGSFRVACFEKSGKDDPAWAVQRNCPDIVYYGEVLPGPPMYSEIEKLWRPGVSIKKVSGEFFPRLNPGADVKPAPNGEYQP